jgi:hypothetical protein
MIKVRMIFLAVTAILLFPRLGWSQVIVIANPSVKSSIASRADLREVFLGSASTLRDGSHVIPVLHGTGPVEEEFVATYLGKSVAAFRASWRSLVFSGQAAMPRSLGSDSAVVAYVARNPDTIGFIDSKTAHESVKVLAVK